MKIKHTISRALRTHLALAWIGTVAAAAVPHSAALATEAPAWYVPSGLYVQYGHANNAQSANLGLVWPWSWSPQTPMGRISGYWDVTLGMWRSSAYGPNLDEDKWFGHIGIAPVFRLAPALWERNGWFMEAAIGLNFIMPKFQNGSDYFGSQLNFGDHVGIGRKFGQHREHELTLRFEHFSNAGYKQPNPGQNYFQLRYTRAW